jgi:hypothetical protein
VKAVAIFNLLVVEIEDGHRPNISQAVFRRKRNIREWHRIALFKEHQGTGGGMGRKDREVCAARNMARPEGQRMPIAEAKIAVRMSVIEWYRHKVTSRLSDL